MRLPASGHLLHGNFQSYLDSYVDSLAHLSSHRGFYFARSRACSLGLSFSRSVSVSWFLGLSVSRSLDLSISRSPGLSISRSRLAHLCILENIFFGKLAPLLAIAVVLSFLSRALHISKKHDPFPGPTYEITSQSSLNTVTPAHVQQPSQARRGEVIAGLCDLLEWP